MFEKEVEPSGVEPSFLPSLGLRKRLSSVIGFEKEVERCGVEPSFLPSLGLGKRLSVAEWSRVSYRRWV